MSQLLNLRPCTILVILCIFISISSNATEKVNPYQQIGFEFAQAINEQNIAQMADMFDNKIFAKTIAKQLFDKPKEIKGFVKGFTAKSSSKQLMTQAFTAVFKQKGEARFTKVYNKSQPFIRIDYPSGGHEYIVLSTNKRRNQKPIITDMLLFSSGNSMSEKIGSTMRLLINPSASTFQKALGIKKLNKAHLQDIKEVGALKNQGKFSEAYKKLKSLPENIQNSKAIVDLAIVIAQSINEEEYRKQLTRLDKLFGDNQSTQFMLIDHHFYNEDYRKIIRSIDNILNKYGPDAALLNLKALTLYGQGKAKSGLEYANQAIKIEPSFQSAYWTLATIYNEQENYSKLVNNLKEFEKTFNYQFTAEDFTKDPFYQNFTKSPEFVSWLLTRN